MTSAPSKGLTIVPTAELRELLRYLHRGQVQCPLSPGDLARVGLQDRSEPIMATLRGLDEAAARAVLVAVLAERGVG